MKYEGMLATGGTNPPQHPLILGKIKFLPLSIDTEYKSCYHIQQ